MRKILKQSRRGLTFSFPSKGMLAIGNRFTYRIERERNEIVIFPSSEGNNTISRKRSGEKWMSLIDLRSSEVRDAIRDMRQIEVRIQNDRIVVAEAQAEAGAGIVLEFPRAQLAYLRKVSGISDHEAVSRILTGTQISIDEYLRDRSILDISALYKDLPDLYTVVSLFSGAGVLDWPFFRDPDHFRLVYAIDADSAACDTYRQNIGPHIIHGDIRKAFTDQGYSQDTFAREPDVIIGGPSCKPFSNANRHTRLDAHPDSDLMMEYIRIVKVLRPKVFAIENVPSILTIFDGNYYKFVSESVNQCGYQVSAKIIQDSEVGGYTTRKRAIILGSRVGPVNFPRLFLGKKRKTVGDALSQITEKWSNFRDVTIPNPATKKRMSFVPQGGNYLDIPEQYRTPGKNRHSSTYRRLAWNEPSPTIVNWRKPPLIHPKEDRTLTVAEAKALQGLPGFFRVMGSLSEMQQQIGNCVPVAIGRYVKEAILAMLNTSRTVPALV